MRSKQSQQANKAAAPATMVGVVEAAEEMPQACTPVRMALFTEDGEPVSIGGEGGSYELPAAGADSLGGVKLAAKVDAVAAADAASASGEAPTAAEHNAAAALANECKGKINAVIGAMKSAGIMSGE